MRFAKVSPDGTYSSPPVAKTNYATMVYIRAGMVFNSGETLAKAVTIATRFSCIRRQGEAVRTPPRCSPRPTTPPGSNPQMNVIRSITERVTPSTRPNLQVAGKKEPRVIEYQTQQHQLFTILSHTFALFFTGKGQGRAAWPRIPRC